MDALLERLRTEASRLQADDFVQRRPCPALILRLDEDWADFNTAIRSTAEILSPPKTPDDLDPDFGLSIRLVLKSDRNPYLDRISIGRATTNDIVIKHPSVSKLHAHFRRLTGGLYGIRDASSTNGVFVNGKRTPDGVPAPLSSGDTVTIGRVDAQYFEPAGLHEWLRKR